MTELFDRIKYVQAYIDDHLEKLQEVLKRVQKAGLKVKAPKLFFVRVVPQTGLKGEAGVQQGKNAANSLQNAYADNADAAKRCTNAA